MLALRVTLSALAVIEQFLGARLSLRLGSPHPVS
jgi:hypothetical protein